MENNDFNFPGMTKKELLLKMGDEFNFYPDNIWIYLYKIGFFGRKTYLVITFENNICVKVQTKKTYGKIDRSRL